MKYTKNICTFFNGRSKSWRIVTSCWPVTGVFSEQESEHNAEENILIHFLLIKIDRTQFYNWLHILFVILISMGFFLINVSYESRKTASYFPGLLSILERLLPIRLRHTIYHIFLYIVRWQHPKASTRHMQRCHSAKRAEYQSKTYSVPTWDTKLTVPWRKCLRVVHPWFTHQRCSNLLKMSV